MLFVFKCSTQADYIGMSDYTLDKVSESWAILDDLKDYKINDFFPAEQDSSLFIILSEFENNNRDMQLIDIQSKVSTLYYNVGKSDLYPGISSNISTGYGEQNLAGLGLSDELLESIQDSENGESGGSENNSSQSGGGSFGTSTYSAKLNIAWELDLWGRIQYSQDSKKSKMLSSLHDLEYARISLKAQFIKLYISSAHINKEIQIFEQNLQNLKNIIDATDRRILGGLASPEDVHLASANYYLYESNLLTKRIEINSIKRNIELMLGRYPASSISISYMYPDNIYDIKSGLVSELILRRPDILSDREKLNSSRSTLIANKRALFPSFTITGSLGQSSSDLDNLFNPNSSIWNVGLNILQPVFQSGKIKKNIEIAGQELSLSDIEYLKTVMNAFYETENCLDLDKNLKAAQNTIEKSVEDMQKAVNYAIRGYELGLVDLMYLLNLQQQLLNTKIQLENIIAKRYLNRIDLILALGGDFEY